MRLSKKLSPLFALFLAAGLGLGQAPTGPADKKPAPKPARSLIRKELLRVEAKDAGAGLRNIFAPQARAGVPMLPAEIPNAPANVPVEEVEVAPVFNINLRYVGFILSGKKLNALIILDGRALAVEEGEVVGEGLRVTKITQTAVEITLPDSSTRSFSLEGEGK